MTALSSNVTHQAELLEKLRSRQALIGIVGLGYVGLPLSLTYAEVGYQDHQWPWQGGLAHSPVPLAHYPNPQVGLE